MRQLNISQAWKAVMAFVSPGAVIIGSAVLTSSDGGAAITSGELVTALVACVVTSATVYGAPNRPSAGPDRAAGAVGDEAGVDPGVDATEPAEPSGRVS